MTGTSKPSPQVAWYEGDKEYTKFSHYFSEALSQTPPVELGSIDEFINERLEIDPGQGGTNRWSRWIRGSASPLSGEDGTDQVNFEMYGLYMHLHKHSGTTLKPSRLMTYAV